MLPFTYSIRNLMRTPSRTAQLIIGAFLVVFLVICASAFNRGMDKSLVNCGSPDNVILLTAGSESSAERSQIPASTPSVVSAGVRGIKTVLGREAVSREIHYMGYFKDSDGMEHNAFFRGVESSALLVHRKVAILEGHFPGTNEIMVGRLAWRRLGMEPEEFKPGSTIMFEGHPFKISGTFAAPGTAFESELWMDLSDLMTFTRRTTVSCIVITLDGATFDDVDLFCKQRLDLELSAVHEPDYYRKLSAFYTPIRVMTWLTACLIASGAIFGGLNTMYAAYVSRKRELATLQAVGYGRIALLISMMQEALLVNLAGALVAICAALYLLDGLSVSFSTGMFTMVFDGFTALLSPIVGVLLAVIGIMAPAWNCLKPKLISALRS